MAVLNYAMGRLNPVVYFVDSKGTIALPPSTEEALKLQSRMYARGYELREAGTLTEIDALQHTMQDQELRERQAQLERQELSLGDVHKNIRDRLYARMVSSATSPYEREFIQAYLQLRDEKRAKYRNRFTADQAAYFAQREFDHPVQQLHKIADSIPEGRDVECIRCHKFRRIDGYQLCFRCTYNVTDEEMNYARANSPV